MDGPISIISLIRELRSNAMFIAVIGLWYCMHLWCIYRCADTSN